MLSVESHVLTVNAVHAYVDVIMQLLRSLDSPEPEHTDAESWLNRMKYWRATETALIALSWAELEQRELELAIMISVPLDDQYDELP